MTPLLDQNLSPRLVQALAGLFPGSIHVHECGLGESADSQVWDFAREKGLTILSKDSDFWELSALRGGPPKVIWLCRAFSQPRPGRESHT